MTDDFKFSVLKCDECTYFNKLVPNWGCQLNFNGICHKIGHWYYVHYPIELIREMKRAYELGKNLSDFHSGGDGT